MLGSTERGPGCGVKSFSLSVSRWRCGDFADKRELGDVCWRLIKLLDHDQLMVGDVNAACLGEALSRLILSRENHEFGVVAKNQVLEDDKTEKLAGTHDLTGDLNMVLAFSVAESNAVDEGLLFSPRRPPAVWGGAKSGDPNTDSANSSRCLYNNY